MSDALFDLPPVSPEPAAYRVLARKYRPQSFAELMGQDALVRTLTNAFASGRIAHAFMLTGVRGVGKTTTARIIAKALNCVGPDGKGGPTITPCGECETCKSIAEGRCVDVLEMDAASRTGVDDVREIIEGVRYAPAAVRTKVYIIDEVHMLSKGAFNALLKTLEEPPPHVKFVFATTEIRKVPVTVLSRCQRFDLKRIEPEVLAGLFARVAKAEDIQIEPEALQLLARVAEGSARDGLSILDQAIAREGDSVTSAGLRAMLGLADRAPVLGLLRAALAGQAAEALTIFDQLYREGVDALTVMQDLADLVHGAARLKVLKEAKDEEGGALKTVAESSSTPALARAWQILLKGLGEVQTAPRPAAAAEMVLIRLAHASTLPTPGELMRQFENAPVGGGGGVPAASAAPTGAPVMKAAVGLAQPVAQALPVRAPKAVNWREVVAMFAAHREGQLYAQLYNYVECVACGWGRLEVRLRAEARSNLVQQISARLQEWTHERWVISIATQGQAVTLAEEDAAATQQRFATAEEHPLVKAVLLAFPGSKIAAVRDNLPVLNTPATDFFEDEAL